MIWLLLFSAVVTALAWAVTRHRVEHKPIAWFLSGCLAVDLARWPLILYVLRPARKLYGDAPFDGWARVAAHFDDGLFLSRRAMFAALAITLFAKRRAWPVAVVWIGSLAAIAAFYPATRGDVLRRCYLAAELASLVVGLGCTLPWAARWERAHVEHACGLIIVSVELATLIGPWFGNPAALWDRAQLVYVVMYTVLMLLQGGTLWLSSRSS